MLEAQNSSTFPQIDFATNSEQDSLFKDSAVYDEPLLFPSGCIGCDCCDQIVTHHDASGDGYCDFHWNNWD